MLQHLSDLPPYVAGFKATGKITWEDYKNIAMPVIDEVAKNYKKVNYLMLIETGIGNFTAGAWLQDMLAGFKHFAKWNRMAIVSDQESVQKVSEAISPLIPGVVQAYPLSELEAAKAWASAEVPEREDR